MRKFTTGMIAGGLIAAASVAVVMSDERTKRQALRRGKKIARRAGDFMDM